MVTVLDIPFTPAELDAIRAACGLTPADRDPDAADLLVILATREILEREFRRWTGLGPGDL